MSLHRSNLDRRAFLAFLASAGAAGVVGCKSSGSAADPRTGPTGATTVGAAGDGPEPSPTSRPRGPVNGDRQLIVIELSGGNDGLSTLQPYNSSVIASQRPRLAVPGEELIEFGDNFGLHQSLAGMAEIGLAAAVGIGSNDPDFSHFEMEQRWWRGDSAESSDLASGFFGRVCDELDVGAPVTGLSLSGGPSPALRSDKAVTVGLAEPGASWFFQQDDPWFAAFQRSLAGMAEADPGDGVSLAAARRSLTNTNRFAESLAEIPEGDNEQYPWTDLGQQLRFAAEVLDLDVGVRVIHTQLGGFDTHTEQAWRHPDLLEEINEAVVALVDDLKARGRWENTLLVTTSEFGRRVPQNDGGTDHGGASTMLVCGDGRSGVHGVPPDLTRLDDDNIVATARFEDYYATIANDWFEIDPDLVLPSGGTPISGLI